MKNARWSCLLFSLKILGFRNFASQRLEIVRIAARRREAARCLAACEAGKTHVDRDSDLPFASPQGLFQSMGQGCIDEKKTKRVRRARKRMDLQPALRNWLTLFALHTHFCHCAITHIVKAIQAALADLPVSRNPCAQDLDVVVVVWLLCDLFVYHHFHVCSFKSVCALF